jgi:phage shock protein A
LPREGDEAEQELRAQLHAARIVVSWLRDEAQRLVGHVQSLHVQLRAERAAVSRLEEEAQVHKTETASTQQNISELKKKKTAATEVAAAN